MKRLLIVDDDVDMCFLLHSYLSRKGYKVTEVHTSLQALEFLEHNQPDLVVCDIWLDEMDGITLLKTAHEKYPGLPFIFITAYDDIKTSAYALKLGALDYVVKPLMPEEIASIIKKALSISKTVLSTTNHKQSRVPSYFSGDSENFKKLERQINLIAPTEKSVIIYGENGTGKETIAKEIHHRSNRKDKPFIVINASSLSTDNSFAHLFGGQLEDGESYNKGYLQRANGGTFFIYELDKIPMDTQRMLLDAINQKQITVDGGKIEELDVRLIAASHENLWHATRTGRLLEGLYHKFNDYSIDLMPLRNRQEDIVHFVKYFIEKANEESGKHVSGTTPEVDTIFRNYIWSDNVRELRNVISRAVLKAPSDVIDSSLLPVEILPSSLVPSKTNDAYAV